MSEIIKITGGFKCNNSIYNFIDIEGKFYNVVSETQVLIFTDCGLILFDLTCSINNKTFNNVDEFLSALFD
jgi:hypothetical protein